MNDLMFYSVYKDRGNGTSAEVLGPWKPIDRLHEEGATTALMLSELTGIDLLVCAASIIEIINKKEDVSILDLTKKYNIPINEHTLKIISTFIKVAKLEKEINQRTS